MRPSGNSEVTSLSRRGRKLAQVSVGLDQRTDFDVGDFRGAGHLQRRHNHLGDVFGLGQAETRVWYSRPIGLVERLHSGRRRAPEMTRSTGANAVGVDFLPQTVGEGLQCVLGCPGRWRLWPPSLRRVMNTIDLDVLSARGSRAWVKANEAQIGPVQRIEQRPQPSSALSPRRMGSAGFAAPSRAPDSVSEA